MRQFIFLTGILLLSKHILFAQDTKLSTKELLTLDFENLMNVKIDKVYSASKKLQLITEAPSLVTIITKDDIKRYQFQTISDALKNQSGFYHTNDRDHDYIGVRGFGAIGDYNNKIALLINGHQINNNFYQSASIGRGFPIPMNLIEKIEIVRGANSSIHGNSAFFATINVITKDSKEFQNVDLGVTLAQQNTDQEYITFAHQFKNGNSILMSANHYKSSGEDIYFKEIDAKSNNIDKQVVNNLYIQADISNFKIELSHKKLKKDIPTAPYNTDFNSKDLNKEDEYNYFNINYQKKLNSKWEISSLLSYNSYQYLGSYPFTKESNYKIYHSATKGEWIDTNIDLNYHANNRQKWLFGAYHREDIKNEFKYTYELSKVIHKENLNNISAFYINHEYKPNKKLIFNIGARYDKYENFDAYLTPKASIIYQLSPNQGFKLLYGEAFRAPNSYERLYSDSDSSQKSRIGYIEQPPQSLKSNHLTTLDWKKENLGIKAEKIKTTELIYEKYFTHKHSLSVSGFYYEIEKLITQKKDPKDGLYFYDNINRAKAKGVEFNYKRELWKNIETNLNYTYQYATINEKWMINSPKHLINLLLFLPIIENRLNTTLNINYNSKRVTKAGSFTDGYFLTNLTLQAINITKNLDLSLKCENLFDVDYMHPAGDMHFQESIPQSRRKLSLSLNYRF
jgi:iron complex outermembrane receptor protein